MGTTSTIPSKRFSRIIPFAFIMYMIAYMDRNNIGYGFSGMEKSLGLSPAMMGTASGIFFIGYLILQIPAGNIAKKYGTKKLLFISQLIWGILAVGTGFVQNGTQLMVLRFLLGMSESAMFPALLVMVTDWFPAKERGRANSLWQMGSTVAGLLVGPVCGLILTYTQWQWLFILEGIPAVIWSFVWLAFIPDKPEKAKFLSDTEREYLKTSFAQDAKEAQPVVTNWKEALANPSIWALIVADFLLNVGSYGLNMWMPTALKNLTKSGFGTVGILTALASALMMLGMYLIPRHSDKTGERKVHAALSIMLGGMMLLLSVYTSHYMLLSILFLMLTGFMGGFLPIFWTFPPMFASAASVGFVMGLINGIGNLGGFFGPTMVGLLVSATGSTNAGLLFSGFCWIFAGVIVLCLKIKKPEPKLKTAAQVELGK